VLGCATLKAASDVPDASEDAGAPQDAGETRDAHPDADGDAPWPSCPTISSGASVFVIDSTDRLFAFDASGKAMGSVALPGPIAGLNGGGIALASGGLYVTIGSPANKVVAYGTDLLPRSLSIRAFDYYLDVPRGIAFDCHDERFVVNNGVGNTQPFSATGAPILPGDGGFAPYYGPSGVAYDPDDEAIWIANYAGFPTIKWGISEFSAADGQVVQTFDHAQHFGAPGPHEEPCSVTVCLKAATGGPTLVVVGFVDDGSQQGKAAVQAYTADGTPRGSPFAGHFTGPYGLSCDSRGRVYVADASGLWIVDLDGADAASPATFPGLTPPIFGVLAAD
jgi:DNA-binding beta-propeller fold protein YncE